MKKQKWLDLIGILIYTVVALKAALLWKSSKRPEYMMVSMAFFVCMHLYLLVNKGE